MCASVQQKGICLAWTVVATWALNIGRLSSTSIVHPYSEAKIGGHLKIESLVKLLATPPHVRNC